MTIPRLRGLPWLVIGALLCLGGCASVKKFIETTATPRGDPATAAMIVVTCEVTEFLEDFDLMDSLFGLDEDVKFTKVVMVDALGFTETAYPQDGLFVFDNLRPGQYTLTLTTAEYYISSKMGNEIYGCDKEGARCPTQIVFEYPTPTQTLSELTFDVQAGDLVYAGDLSYWETHEPPFDVRNKELGSGFIDFHRHDSGTTVSVVRLVAPEIEALEKFLEKNADSPWAETVRLRLAELRKES